MALCSLIQMAFIIFTSSRTGRQTDPFNALFSTTSWIRWHQKD